MRQPEAQINLWKNLFQQKGVTDERAGEGVLDHREVLELLTIKEVKKAAKAIGGPGCSVCDCLLNFWYGDPGLGPEGCLAEKASSSV